MTQCIELDGCCYTHSPCFEIDEDGYAQACGGWPCGSKSLRCKSCGFYKDTPNHEYGCEE